MTDPPPEFRLLVREPLRPFWRLDYTGPDRVRALCFATIAQARGWAFRLLRIETHLMKEYVP